MISNLSNSNLQWGGVFVTIAFILIEINKLNNVASQAWAADVLSRVA